MPGVRWWSGVVRGGLPLIGLSLGLVACGPKDIGGLRTFTYSGGDQRSGVLTYSETPPAGGPYNPLWQTCAAYAQPVYNEYAVHSLARGAVWVTYRPGLDAAEIGSLKTLLAGQPAALLSPYPNLPAPIVMTAWNRQLSVDQASDARLTRFLKEVLPENSAPEKGSPCSGGFGGTR